MFVGGFSNKADICEQFHIDDFDGEVLYAEYDNGGYDGSAAVVFVSEGKLWMASGSHCSCYGLENQWDPEEITIPMLKHIVAEGYGVDARTAAIVLEALEKFGVTDGDAIQMVWALK